MTANPLADRENTEVESDPHELLRAGYRVRYMVDSYLVRDEGRKTRYAVVDTRHRRWVNLCWSERSDAQDYADRLNLRATSRVTALGSAR